MGLISLCPDFALHWCTVSLHWNWDPKTNWRRGWNF